MSFKDLLVEIGPDNLLTDKLLPLLLQLKPNDVDQSIALIVSEILFPNSQGAGFLSPKSAPEADADGALLQTCFKTLDQQANFRINWYEVFSEVHKNLFPSSQRNIAPLPLSIHQLLSSLDFKEGPLDIFLNYDWWFNKTLLSVLQAMPNQQNPGAYDITLSNNLALCLPFEQPQQPPKAKTILKFINITKLELQVIKQIQQQQQQQISDGERQLNAFITQRFELDYRTYPEYLIVAGISLAEQTPFITDLIDNSFGILIESDNPAINDVLNTVKDQGPDFIIQRFIKFYQTRNTVETVDKLLSIAGKLGIVDQLLITVGQIDPKMSAKFIVESSLYGIDFKSLIESKTKDPQLKHEFYPALLQAVDERAQRDYNVIQQIPQGSVLLGDDPINVLRLPVANYLLDKLKSSNGLVDSDKLKNLQLLVLTTYPRLINFGNGHDEAILSNAENSICFLPAVEQEMKSSYKKMYNKEVEIKVIVDMLIAMKNSDDPHQQDVFACMIHSLLDEYKFFAGYPLAALASTSLLFGALLEKELIQGTTLTVALNFIWESCNQPPDSHLFKFAVQSLYNFKSKLHEYPIYCKHLLECRSLNQHARMFQIVKDAANGIPCSNQNATPTPEATGPKYQSITVSEKLVGTVEQEEPPANISDRLLFSVNNMTEDNLRLGEVNELLRESHYAWFSNYIVVDRAKAEPNNHGLYARLVKAIDDPIFYGYILSITLSEIDHIIRNFRDSRPERNQLKNLGAWLGKITLGEDKPLRRDQIALKFLLVEAYDFKTLSLIIPFVAKILDQAQYSKVFRPPNPWVLGIIKVLAELYEYAELSLNLKFEIEVLLNSFDLKVKDITPSTIIKDHNPDPTALAAMFGIHPETVSLTNEITRLSLEQQQPELQPQYLGGPQKLPGVGPELGPVGPNLGQPQLQQPLQAQVQPQQPQEGLDTSFSNLIGTSIFIQNPNWRRAFQASLTRAVRECAVPILTRVSEAVLTTTEALVRKDFAIEKDTIKFRNSYQNLAQQLAHSMVLCSGKKVLSESIESAMIQLLGSVEEIPLGELNTAILENVGLCVDIVDKIAQDNISELIDERMKIHVLLREQHNPAQPFIDEGASEYAMRLPDPLGLKPEGLSAAQLRIYETFGNNPNVTDDNIIAPPIETQVVAPRQPIQQQQQPEIYASDQLYNIIQQHSQKAIQLATEAQETTISELNPNHPIMVALSQVLSLAQNNAIKYPELLLKVAQHAVNYLFTQGHENPLGTEIYVVILDKLCEYSPSTAKDVTWWLVHSEDQRKFNMPVMLSLLKVQLVSPLKLDSSLGKLIAESGNPIVVKFAANLLSSVFSASEPQPIALRSEFAYTLDSLSKFVSDDSTEELRQAKIARDNLFEVLGNLASPASNQLYSQLGYVFSEWVKLLTHPEQSDDLQDQFIEGLLANEILTDPEYFQTFFKSAVELSITVFATEHEIRTKTLHESYLAVDCLAMLIIKIILRFESSTEAISYLKKIIPIILSALANDHETEGSNWNERAYFRLFSSILSFWSDSTIVDIESAKLLDATFLNYMAEVLTLVQPIIFPAFIFAWITLISHRMLLPRLLELPDKAGYNSVVKLLSALLKFQSIYSREGNNDVFNVIFKAINRIFIGILHDYPEFLVECHYQLITALPVGFIQLRNIILSATPSHVSVPDPFTQGLKVERLPEINEAPLVFYSPCDDLVKVQLKKPVENFLRIPAPALMRTIYSGLKLNHPKELNEFGKDVISYNVKLINALVLHVGISAVADRLPNNVRGFNVRSSQVALLVDLMNQGSSEFKFHLINAIANQLRYPNSHTHWFIGIILHFFSSNSIWGSSQAKLTVQELITRVLVERRVVNKPHPWGLTIVFTELIKNGDYGFFDLPFVKDASSEVQNMFEVLSVHVKGSTPSGDN
ncbi:CCR4-Not complex component, Not1-domain-containing protein [Scheffersomyces coipomensis]|uniref:CCR4-Not complex component, Not1-domain-containing protein n=1 Tax=Scheffersomyces coipomensis TaxID=1788519 RepID=UPI00315CC8DA